MRAQLPSGWTVRKLGEVLRQVERPVRVDQNATYRMLGVRLYAAGCHTHSEVAGDALVTPGLSLLKADDVVYNKMWAAKGAFAVAQGCHAGLHGTSEYPMFECRAIDPNYIRRWLARPRFWGEAAALCKGTTSRARLAPRDFLRLAIVFPPLPEQRAIAEALQSVDEVIDRSRAVIEQLGRVKKALVQELLTRGLPGKPAATWGSVRLGDLLTEPLRNGRCPAEDDAGPAMDLLVLSAIQDGRVLPKGHVKPIYLEPEQARNWTLRPDDVLVVRGSGSRALVGRCGLVPDPAPICVYPDTMIRVRPDRTRCSPAFLVLAWNARGIREQVLVAAKTTNAIWKISQGDMEAMRVPLPSPEEQREICGLVSSVDTRRNAEQAVLEAAHALKTGLMQDLLTGRRRWSGANIAHAGGGD